MKIRPIYDRVLVERIPDATTTKGGLVIPEQAKNPAQRGIVVAVGEGRVFDGPAKIVTGAPKAPEPLSVSEYLRQPLVVKVGDCVLFGRFSGTEIEVDGQTLFILREDEIMAIAEGADWKVKPELEQPEHPQPHAVGEPGVGLSDYDPNNIPPLPPDAAEQIAREVASEMYRK
jgi:chaperonin GroES